MSKREPLYPPRDAKPAEPYNAYGCLANGCPLPGVFSDSTTGGGRYACFIHARVDHGNHDIATTMMRQHAWLIAIMADVSRGTTFGESWRANATDMCHGQNRADLAPNTGESRVAYHARIRAALSGLTTEWIDRTPKATRNSSAMSHIKSMLSQKRIDEEEFPPL